MADQSVNGMLYVRRRLLPGLTKKSDVEMISRVVEKNSSTTAAMLRDAIFAPAFKTRLYRAYLEPARWLSIKLTC